MIWIKNYAMIQSANGEYRIVSMEDSVCPWCGGVLRAKDSRVRWCRNSDGEKYRLRIRRLKCKVCGKIHAELPDHLIPYRRYSYDTVKNSCMKKEYCGAEAATIRAWKIWFSEMEYMSKEYNTLEKENADQDVDMDNVIRFFCQIKNQEAAEVAAPNK